MKLGILSISCALALVGLPQAGGTEDLPAAPSAQVALQTDGSLGVWQSFDEAVGWFRARAAAGDAGARYELAHLQFVGLVPQRDAGETLGLLTAAAEAGHDQAQLLLARIREFGYEGTPPNPVQAFKWYARAAATAPTADLRAAAAEACARLRPRMRAAQIAEAETLAALPWSESCRRCGGDLRSLD
jgi:TPR repeat protein